MTSEMLNDVDLLTLMSIFKSMKFSLRLSQVIIILEGDFQA